MCESGAWRKSWGQRRRRTFHTVRVAAARVVVAVARTDLSCGEKPRGGDLGDDQRECERARRGLLRGVYGATRFTRWGGDSRAERWLRVARPLASAVASRRPWLGSKSDERNLLGRPVAAFSRSRTLCWCSARSAHEGPPLVHSAHSLLSSFGILTILPTHASSLALLPLPAPSPLLLLLSLLSLFSPPFSRRISCVKKESVSRVRRTCCCRGKAKSWIWNCTSKGVACTSRTRMKT